MAQYKMLNNDSNSEVDRIVCNYLTSEFCKNYVLVGEEDTCMPEEYIKFAEALEDFEIRDSDVIVASYPKTGTTWTQEMVWLIANDLNFTAAEVELGTRFPLLELCTLFDWEKMDEKYNQKSADKSRKCLQYIDDMESPRFIKIHLPFCLLPEQIRNGSKSPKIIYTVRNPKDTCVSYFHYGQLFHRWNATFEDFCKVFLADKVMYGSFWKHVLGYWNQCHAQNLCVVSYEEMKADLPAVIIRVAKFLGKELTGEQVQLLAKHLSFEAMKNNTAVNHESILDLKRKQNSMVKDGAFMRSGTVGKYKDEMSSDIINNFNAWIKKNTDGTDFCLYHNY